MSQEVWRSGGLQQTWDLQPGACLSEEQLPAVRSRSLRPRGPAWSRSTSTHSAYTLPWKQAKGIMGALHRGEEEKEQEEEEEERLRSSFSGDHTENVRQR